MRDAPTPKSIEVFLAEVRDQLAAQRGHVENLDAKAGVVLGFSGLLAALAAGDRSGWVDLARLASVVAGVAALLAFLPRGRLVVDLRGFRRRCLALDPAAGLLTLVDTHLNVLDHTEGVIDHKSRWLKASIAALLLAIILAFVGLAT